MTPRTFILNVVSVLPVAPGAAAFVLCFLSGMGSPIANAHWFFPALLLSAVVTAVSLEASSRAGFALAEERSRALGRLEMPPARQTPRGGGLPRRM